MGRGVKTGTWVRNHKGRGAPDLSGAGHLRPPQPLDPKIYIHPSTLFIQACLRGRMSVSTEVKFVRVAGELRDRHFWIPCG